MKKREKYRRRRRDVCDSGDKKSGLNYDEIQTYEDVSHEFLETDVADQKEKTEENEVSEYAETDEKSETETESACGEKADHSEEAEAEDTSLPQETQRNDTEQGGSFPVSEDEQKA